MNFAGDYQKPERMNAKLSALPLPSDMSGMHVLDVGCDHGFWCALARDRGASAVLGLDRGRNVRGRGFVDLADDNSDRLGDDVIRFARIELGRQWYEYGRFDLVLAMSVYHHIYEQAGGDHRPVWYWLRRHVAEGGTLIWEGPTGTEDSVVARNVSPHHHDEYNRDAILAAASRWFYVRVVGPAVHEPTREVWECTPRTGMSVIMPATVNSGAGGASTCFEYADGRRIGEVEAVLGWRPFPGSLNLKTDVPFDWDTGYYRSRVLDLVNRRTGLEGAWAERWARFYPVNLRGQMSTAFRFEGERYSPHLVELLAPVRLRDRITDARIGVELAR